MLSLRTLRVDFVEDRVNHSESSSAHDASRSELLGLSLAALGVVFGDIGTSPLYAFRECFSGPHAVPLNAASILGVLSLILWSLIVVISIKYLVWVMRADNRGEGGILALLALAIGKCNNPRRVWILACLGIFGAALMYGDGIITPAITVLSAVEGLNVITTGFEPFVVPLTLCILIGIFAVQSKGTASIGAIFGPIILLWFVVLGILGIKGIMLRPDVIFALNPQYAINFIIEQPRVGFLSLGAVFLVCTGGEALYADMGHFGRRPIKLAWFSVVLPGLVLNYFGQGALLLTDPMAAENPFYRLAPKWALYPLVALATAAASIASQALISGAFSLTKQAVQLGYSPRLRIDHTSSQEMGQIYVPYVNVCLLIGAVWLVLAFQSSSSLASAYGIAVASTMVITTILAAVVCRIVWHWSWWRIVGVLIIFLTFDLAFFSANVAKITHGGWVPLLIGFVIFTLMTTWRKGRQLLAAKLRSRAISMDDFIKAMNDQKTLRIPGTAFFMTSDPEGAPPALQHNFKHNKVVHERLIILTMTNLPTAYMSRQERLKIEILGQGIFRWQAFYGFMEVPSVHDVLACAAQQGFTYSENEMTFFLGRETLIATKAPGMALWREHLFAFMSRNAQRATAFFGIPADQVIEVGVQVEL